MLELVFIGFNRCTVSVFAELTQLRDHVTRLNQELQRSNQVIYTFVTNAVDFGLFERSTTKIDYIIL